MNKDILYIAQKIGTFLMTFKHRATILSFNSERLKLGHRIDFVHQKS